MNAKYAFGKEARPRMIPGACDPRFAHMALEAEPEIGTLLPCNVVMREQQSAGIALEVRGKLEHMLAAI